MQCQSRIHPNSTEDNATRRNARKSDRSLPKAQLNVTPERLIFCYKEAGRCITQGDGALECHKRHVVPGP
eukprot:4368127-Alexandrium_andersonii.AAC.1